MRITEFFKTGKPFPSLEIVPPLGGITKDDLLASIQPLMEFAPRYINVTTHRDEFLYEQQPDGSFVRRIVNSRVSPVAVCASIQAKFPVEVVPHIICGGQTADGIKRQLQDFRFMGIDNIMALRGDSLSGEKRFTHTSGGYSHASELVEAVRAEGDFCVGFPEEEGGCRGGLHHHPDVLRQFRILPFRGSVPQSGDNRSNHPGPETSHERKAGRDAPGGLFHRSAA